MDVEGVEPLGNVFEFYGGNEDRMRTAEDYESERDHLDGKSFNVELKKLNRHMNGDYVELPKPSVVSQ